jgi:hypothetical protein
MLCFLFPGLDKLKFDEALDWMLGFSLEGKSSSWSACTNSWSWRRRPLFSSYLWARSTFMSYVVFLCMASRLTLLLSVLISIPRFDIFVVLKDRMILELACISLDYCETLLSEVVGNTWGWVKLFFIVRLDLEYSILSLELISCPFSLLCFSYSFYSW